MFIGGGSVTHAHNLPLYHNPNHQGVTQIFPGGRGSSLKHQRKVPERKDGIWSIMVLNKMMRKNRRKLRENRVYADIQWVRARVWCSLSLLCMGKNSISTCTLFAWGLSLAAIPFSVCRLEVAENSKPLAAVLNQKLVGIGRSILQLFPHEWNIFEIHVLHPQPN